MKLIGYDNGEVMQEIEIDEESAYDVLKMNYELCKKYVGEKLSKSWINQYGWEVVMNGNDSCKMKLIRE